MLRLASNLRVVGPSCSLPKSLRSAALGFALAGLLSACASPARMLPAEPRGETVQPAFIPFAEGEPSTVFWSEETRQLFIADDRRNQIWRWTDGGGLVKQATHPSAEPNAEASMVGQIVQRRDGTLLVVRLGQHDGGDSSIAWLRPDGSSGLVPGVDSKQKRLGLTEAPDGTLYGTAFSRAASGPGRAGVVTRIEFERGESVVADGFGKLVGIVALRDALYVADQSAGIIYSAPLSALPARAREWAEFAKLPVPDQLCVGPEGSIFSGQFKPAPGSADPVGIRQIHADGSVTRLATTPELIRASGVAYDSRDRRLFVADAGSVGHFGVHVLLVPRARPE